MRRCVFGKSHYRADENLRIMLHVDSLKKAMTITNMWRCVGDCEISYKTSKAKSVEAKDQTTTKTAKK